MPGDYAILAPIYDSTGMADYTRRLTPHLIDYAQQIDWLGRRIVVLGCGTGASIEYLSRYPYNLTGIDNSEDMLDVARSKLNAPDLNLRWLQLDIRELASQTISLVDMVLALNVMNELNSLRDLEVVFGGVAKLLEPGKLFVFDMQTVQGLTEDGVSGDGMVHDNGNTLTVFSKNEFDYERQMHTRIYTIFQRENSLWRRSEARLVLRAFPVQAVGSLLQRSGFAIRTLLDNNLEIYEPGVSRAGRVIFIAERQ